MTKFLVQNLREIGVELTSRLLDDFCQSTVSDPANVGGHLQDGCLKFIRHQVGFVRQHSIQQPASKVRPELTVLRKPKRRVISKDELPPDLLNRPRIVEVLFE